MKQAKQTLKRFLKTLPGIEFIHEFYYLGFRKDYSQYGEQEMLSRHLLHGQEGISSLYLELGCNKPLRFSNTYGLYKHGWRGWCVDAGDFAALWQFFRPRDRFINRAVVAEEGLKEITFYEIRHTSLVATTDREHAQQWANQYREELRSRTVPCLTLEDLLDQFQREFNRYPRIILTDIEGLDSAVFKSVDLRLLKTRGVDFLLLEALHSEAETIRYLGASGYRLIDRAGNSLLFSAG